jgi:hypothetical protein
MTFGNKESKRLQKHDSLQDSRNGRARATRLAQGKPVPFHVGSESPATRKKSPQSTKTTSVENRIDEVSASGLLNALFVNKTRSFFFAVRCPPVVNNQMTLYDLNLS